MSTEVFPDGGGSFVLDAVELIFLTLHAEEGDIEYPEYVVN